MQTFVLKNWNTSLGMLLRHFKGAFLWFFGVRKGESTNPSLQMTQTKIYFLLKLSNFSGLKFINPSWFDPSPLSVFCVGRARGSLCWRREAQAAAAWLAAGDWLLALVGTHSPGLWAHLKVSGAASINRYPIVMLDRYWKGTWELLNL